jgi:hypothetical protein
MHVPIKPPPLSAEQLGVTEPEEIWGLQRAKKEVTEAARWARQVGFHNIAPRLEFAARLIQEEINKHKLS